MGKYSYFVSYANADLDAYLEHFLSDLAVQVRMWTGSQDPDLFFDRESITPGSEWTEAIDDALGTSHLLVSLLSPAYFESERCGKEWEVFRQRAVRQQALQPGVRPSFVIPVRWVVGLQPLPTVLANLQLDADGFPEEYRREGLRYLMRLHKLENAYQHMVMMLSRRVIDAVRANPFSEDRPVSLRDAPNAFAKRPRASLEPNVRVGPEYPAFAILSNEQDLEVLRLTARRVCAREGLRFDVLDVNSTLMERLREAELANRPLVLVVDPTALERSQEFGALMKEYTRHSFQNTAVVYLRPSHPIRELEEELRRTLDSLRIRIVQNAMKRSVVDLPYIGLPTLRGPG